MEGQDAGAYSDGLRHFVQIVYSSAKDYQECQIPNPKTEWSMTPYAVNLAV